MSLSNINRLFRLLQYQCLLERLLTHYGPNHPDRADCRTACDTLKDLMMPVRETLEHSENLATLCELQRDIVGFENLIQPGRTFIRHGCLLKHSRKGYQQRMFFLVSLVCYFTVFVMLLLFLYYEVSVNIVYCVPKVV